MIDPNKPVSMIQNLVPGQQQISAADINAMMRIVRAWRRGQHGRIPGSIASVSSEDGVMSVAPRRELWVGIVTDVGPKVNPDDYTGTPPSEIPDYEPDLVTPTMYWVSRARKRIDMTLTQKDPVVWEEYPETSPLHTVVPACNIAELGTQTRSLGVGEVVLVTSEWQPTETKPIKVYTFDRSVGGGGCTWAVVISCQFDSVAGTLTVTCSRLLSIPYGYDANPPDEDKFVAFAGIEPMIVPDQHVLLFRNSEIPGDTSIRYTAISVLSVDRTQVNPPKMECLTEFSEPCAGDLFPEVCEDVTPEE